MKKEFNYILITKTLTDLDFSGLVGVFCPEVYSLVERVEYKDIDKNG
jgi:hypothetical protein